MSKGITTILLIVIILAVGVIAAVGGYYYGTNSTATTTQLVTVAKTTTPKVTTTVVGATTTAVDTANWKIYTNDQYGFSIKYPESWYAREKKDLTTKTIPDGLIVQLANYKYLGDVNKGNIDVVAKNENLNEIFSFPIIDSGISYKNFKESQAKYLVKKEDKQIGDATITIEYYRNPEAPGSTETQIMAAYFTSPSGKKLFISNIGVEGVPKKEELNLLSRMISTLSFKQF